MYWRTRPHRRILYKDSKKIFSHGTVTSFFRILITKIRFINKFLINDPWINGHKTYGPRVPLLLLGGQYSSTIIISHFLSVHLWSCNYSFPKIYNTVHGISYFRQYTYRTRYVHTDVRARACVCVCVIRINAEGLRVPIWRLTSETWYYKIYFSTEGRG